MNNVPSTMTYMNLPFLGLNHFTCKHKVGLKLNQSQHETVNLKKQRKVSDLAKLVVAMRSMMKNTS